MNGNGNGDKRGVPPLHVILLYVSLSLGGGSGALTLYSTSDRYHQADSERDLALRDERILNLALRITDLKKQVQAIDDTHPPPDVLKHLDDLEARLREIERSE